MTSARSHPATALDGRGESALLAVHTAGAAVTAAKRSRSAQKIDRANRDLQAAVDVARGRGIEWGSIGSALGMARGNAYQRFRKKSGRRGSTAGGGVRISA